MEVWKDIEGYEGYYQISTSGNVRSLDRVDSSGRSLKGRLMAIQIGTGGYCYIWLSKNGIKKRYLVHRLVAKAFIDKDELRPEVNHIDEDKTNNQLNNLEWCTSSENKLHNNLGLRASKTRRKNGTYKVVVERLSKPIVSINIETGDVNKYESLQSAQRKGFSAGNISSACKGKLKTYKGCKWEYID